jgi:putative flippase GtrA
VGVVGLAVDLGLFNLLALTSAYENDANFPAFAKTGTVLTSMVVVFFLNQSFTFKSISFDFSLKSRVALFWVSQAIGFGLVLAPFLIARYLLGFESLLVDNITGGLIGPAIAFVFRYWFSRRFTFAGTSQG